MKLHNATSLTMYQFLIDDSQKEIDYWNGQPDGDIKTKQLSNFNKLLSEHQANFARVKKQAENDPGDIHEELNELINWLEDMLNTFGGLLGEKVKEFYVALINAARKLLEGIFKK